MKENCVPWGRERRSWWENIYTFKREMERNFLSWFGNNTGSFIENENKNRWRGGMESMHEGTSGFQPKRYVRKWTCKMTFRTWQRAAPVLADPSPTRSTFPLFHTGPSQGMDVLMARKTKLTPWRARSGFLMDELVLIVKVWKIKLCVQWESNTYLEEHHTLLSTTMVTWFST